jgi:hypothetical protein
MVLRPSPRRRDRGSETVEWGAALLLVAAVVAVLASAALPESVRDNIENAICRVFNPSSPQSCQSRADLAYKPDACEVSRSNDKRGSSFDVAIFNVGRDLTFIRTMDSRGKTRIYALHGDSAGVGGGVGVGVNWGAVNVGVGLGADASLSEAQGDGWEFDTPEEADRFVEDIMDRAEQEAIRDTGPPGWLIGGILGAVDPPNVREPDIRRYQIALGGNASAGAGFNVEGDASGAGRPREGKGSGPEVAGGPGVPQRGPNLGADVSVNGSETGIVEQNTRTGETTVSLIVGGGVQGNANYVVDGEHRRGRLDGVVALTYDGSGNVTMLGLTRVATNGNQQEVTTTTLPVTTEEQRRAVSEYLAVDQIHQAAVENPRNGVPIPGLAALPLTWDDFAPVDPPGPNATPLQEQLYQNGETTRTQNEFDLHDQNYGARVKAGLSLGLNVNYTDDHRTAVEAEYLGAPGPGGQRRWKDFPECA